MLHGYSDFQCFNVRVWLDQEQANNTNKPQKEHTTTCLDGSLISLVLYAGHCAIKGTPCEQPLCSMCVTVLLMNLSMTCHSTGVHVIASRTEKQQMLS